VPLARISDQLRAGTVDVDVDISDCTQDEREAATTVLMNMQGLDSPRAGDTVETLYYAWVDQTFRAKARDASAKPLTEWERSALLPGERPITSRR
jgi:hypothetical protein